MRTFLKIFGRGLPPTLALPLKGGGDETREGASRRWPSEEDSSASRDKLLRASITACSPVALPPSPLEGEGRGGGDAAATRGGKLTPHLTRARSIFVKNENRARVVLPLKGGGGERTDRMNLAFALDGIAPE